METIKWMSSVLCTQHLVLLWSFNYNTAKSRLWNFGSKKLWEEGICKTYN